MIVQRLENWKRVFSGEAWRRAFEALEGFSADSPEGEIEIQGREIFARVMSYPTRSPKEAVLESHRRYIDIQMSLAGSERIDWFPPEGLEVKTPYDEAKDVVFYQPPGPAPAGVDVFPRTFVVLFPEDPHMPQLMTGAQPETVKKVVIKLQADLVGAMGDSK